MKKIIRLVLSISILILMSNCASGKKQMKKGMDEMYIGMPIAEFNKVFPKKELTSSINGVKIYKVSKRVWYDSDGSGSSRRYFYFDDNKLVLVSSKVGAYFPSEKNYENVYTGMNISEFKNKHSKAKNEYLSKNITVYSIKYMDKMDDNIYRKFYYFTNNKLDRVDKGEKAVDYRIKID